MNQLLILAVSISNMFTADLNNQKFPAADSISTQFCQSSDDPCNEGDDEDLEPMLSGSVTYNSMLTPNIPIYHACIEIKTLGGSSVAIIGSDINGHYFFNSVANGSYNLVFSAPGFTPQTIPVTVSGTPQPVDAVMY